MEWDTEAIILLLAGLLLFLLGFLLGQRSSKHTPPPQNQWQTPPSPSWEQPYPSVPTPPILPPLPPTQPYNRQNRPDLILDDLYPK